MIKFRKKLLVLSSWIVNLVKMALSSNSGPEGIELLPLNKQQQQPLQQNSCLTLTPKMKRANVGKKLQFSTPECSVTPISALPGSSNRVLVPSRKR